MRRRWLALVLVALAAHGAHAAEAPGVVMSEPRGLGHFVGDVITRTAEIDAAAGEDFVAASLPQPGQLAYWLELRDVEAASTTAGGQRRLTLRLGYQLFYVPIDTRKLKIPAVNIELKGGSDTRIVSIPAFTVMVSPLREIYPEKSGETTATFLKQDAPAERLRTGPARTAALVAALGACLAALGFAFQRAWWPFHARPGRPFTEARRVVFDHRQSYPHALLALHRAFDHANGGRLLSRDLAHFLARRPEQEKSRADTERFYAASQTLFYAGDAVAAEAALPRSALEALANQLSANERAGG